MTTEESQLECHHCGLPAAPAEDHDADEYDFCRCEFCYVCGEATHAGTMPCACERAAAGSGPIV